MMTVGINSFRALNRKVREYVLRTVGRRDCRGPLSAGFSVGRRLSRPLGVPPVEAHGKAGGPCGCQRIEAHGKEAGKQ